MGKSIITSKSLLGTELPSASFLGSYPLPTTYTSIPTSFKYLCVSASKGFATTAGSNPVTTSSQILPPSSNFILNPNLIFAVYDIFTIVIKHTLAHIFYKFFAEMIFHSAWQFILFIKFHAGFFNHR